MSDQGITGGCLCGYIRYVYSGAAGPASYCHCEDCRRHTGSAFNIGVRFERAAFELTGGAPASFTKTADSGNELTRHFCPRCGSPIWTSSPVHPETIFVKAGTLDDPALVQPVQENWLRSAVPWSRIPNHIRRYTKGTGSTEFEG